MTIHGEAQYYRASGGCYHVTVEGSGRGRTYVKAVSGNSVIVTTCMRLALHFDSVPLAMATQAAARKAGYARAVIRKSAYKA
jgi:hypothetical protein